MGLDLAVCPVKYADHLEWWLGFERLSFHRDYDLFEQIDSNGRQEPDEPIEKVCNPQPLPEGVEFEWYGDEGVRKETQDPYGSDLTFVRAFEFHKVDVSKSHPWNKCIIDFLKSLPAQTPIVLWWH